MSENKKEKLEKKEPRKSDVDEHITRRYELKKRLGKGAYGIVWKAVDKKSNDIVAVKKIFEAFRNQTDAQRTFREIMFLQAFKDHPNIIRLRGLHKATNNKDIYLVFDFMDSDLHHVIKKETVLKDIHKRYIMYQLFRATRYLHSGNVIHRDQKPSNILINSDCKIKIADFGLARSLTHANEDVDDGILTDYVATRWYRAPEILVASKRYTKGVDMWSLGCILGEMLLGKPLFPGTSTVNQMERIMAVLPNPTPEEIYSMCSGYGKGLLEGSVGPKTSLKDLIRSPCDEAMDLVSKLLVFDPNKRLTASEALNHPYVSNFRNGRELTLNCNVIPPLDDDIQLTVSEYRNKLYEMMAASAERKRLAAHTSPTVESFTNDRMNALKEKYSYCQRTGCGDGKVLEEKHMRHRSKNSSVEDLRERNIGPRTNPVYRSDQPPSGLYYSLTKGALLGPTIKRDGVSGNQKKIASPHHKSSMPHPRNSFGWSDRQRFLCSSVKAPMPPKPRYDEGGGGDYRAKESCSGQQPFKTALTQVKEKLRQAQATNGQLSTLPKVSQKTSLQRQPSPTQGTRYNPKHGVLTTSALQEIRAVLKR